MSALEEEGPGRITGTLFCLHQDSMSVTCSTQPRVRKAQQRNRSAPANKSKRGKKKKKHRISLLALVPNKESLGYSLAVADSQINFISDICNTEK